MGGRVGVCPFACRSWVACKSFLSRPCGEEAQRDLTCHDPLAWGWRPWSLSCGMRTEEPVTWLRHTHLGRGGQKSWCDMGEGTWEGTGLAVGTGCPQGQPQKGGTLPKMVLGVVGRSPRGVEGVEPREGSRGQHLTFRDEGPGDRRERGQRWGNLRRGGLLPSRASPRP